MKKTKQTGLTAIFACDEKWGIGKDGDMPWPTQKHDMKWFQSVTEESTIVMGRITWDSLPKKPLSNRKNIVVTRRPAAGADEYWSTSKLLHELSNKDFKETAIIIGGAQLFNLVRDNVDHILITKISGDWECDTILPYEYIKKNFKKTKVEHKHIEIESWKRK